MPIQKNGFFRHREPVQNPSVFKSLVLFKDRMVTNCLMQFCLAIPCRQIACLRDILSHWNCFCKGKSISFNIPFVLHRSPGLQNTGVYLFPDAFHLFTHTFCCNLPVCRIKMVSSENTFPRREIIMKKRINKQKKTFYRK